MRSIKSRRTYRVSSLLIAAAAAAGCASAPQRVAPVGQDAFRVSVTAPSFARQVDANSKAIDAANAFCGQMSEQVLFRESQESGVHSWSPKREDLIFVCARAEDAGTRQASLR
jgi:hypothetical protein